MAANNVHSTPVQPKYVLRNPLEVRENTKSIQLIRIKDNESFLGFPIPDKKVSSDRNPEWKISLASAVLPTAGVPLSRILNHPNIVGLVDIIHTDSLAGSTKHAGITANTAVYEDMNQGSLDLILPNPENYPKFTDLAAWRAHATPNPNRFSLPESLCWHVLSNINKALLWLHTGVKQTDTKDDWQKHDDDWQPILIRDVSPKQIWFKRTGGGATYGQCKLGGFGKAVVTGFPGGNVAKSEKKEGLSWHFQAPVRFFSEILINRSLLITTQEQLAGTETWGPASEIWALGATVFTMMTGIPPPQQFEYQWAMSRMSDKPFTSGLKNLVSAMLKVRSTDRPTTAQLVGRIEQGWEEWRATDDAIGYVDWKDRSRGREVNLQGEVEEKARMGWGIIDAGGF